MGYGIWDIEYGIWNMEHGTWNMGWDKTLAGGGVAAFDVGTDEKCNPKNFIKRCRTQSDLQP